MGAPDCWITPSCGTLTALNGPLKWAVPDQPVAPPITTSQYVRWVKGSLNRLLGCTLLDNDSKSDQYRTWVKEFQINQHLTPNGEVNSQTQDALMKLNRNNSPDYVEWVQRALNRSGDADAKLPVSGDWNDATSDVVRDFQNNEGLVVDGFVGAKTETALLRRTGIRVPGRLVTATPYRPKRPDPHVWQDSLAPGLRLNVWLNAMIIERGRAGSASQSMLCMMQKLAASNSVIGAFSYLTGKDISAYIDGGWPPKKDIQEICGDAREQLLKITRQMQGHETYAKAWQGFQSEVVNLYTEIHDGRGALVRYRRDHIDAQNRNILDLLKWSLMRQEKAWTLQYCFGPLVSE